MATVVLRAKGASFSKNVGALQYVPPILSGLLGWYFLGDDLAASQKNWAPGGGDLTVTGSPVYGAGYATLSGTNYFDTGYVDPAEFTLLAVAKGTNTTSAYVSSFLNSSSEYAMINAGATNLFRAGGYFGAAGNFQRTSVNTYSDLNRFEFIAGTGENAPQQLSFYWPRVAEVTAGSAPANARTSGVRNILLGRAHGTFLVASDMAFAGVYSRALSEAEISSIYSHLQTVMGARGISI